MVITAVSYNELTVKMSSRWFIWRGGSDEEHIITAGWWCKLAMMMDYHCWLVRQSGGDSYRPVRSYEPAVILVITSGTYYEPLVIAITISFNDISGDKGIGARSECSSCARR